METTPDTAPVARMTTVGQDMEDITSRLIEFQFDQGAMSQQFEIARQMVEKVRDASMSLEELGADFANLLIGAHALHQLSDNYRRVPGNEVVAEWCFDTAQKMLTETANIMTLLMAKSIPNPETAALN